MAGTIAVEQPVPVAIPIRDLVPWVLFGGLMLLLMIYFVGAEEGATSIVRASTSTSSSTTLATSSAFPATDGSGGTI